MPKEALPIAVSAERIGKLFKTILPAIDTNWTCTGFVPVGCSC